MGKHWLHQGMLVACVLSCSATVSAANTKDSQSFVGIGITDGTKYESPIEFEPVFRLGAIFDHKHRIAANYSHGFSSGVTSIHFAYDYLYPFTDSGNWQVFGGGSLGYKFGLHDKNDWTFGGQTGIRYRFSAETSVDFGYRVFDTLDDWKEHELGQLGNVYISIDFMM
ncbi:hypothetical protein RJ45_08490 [Photobacterium gaetbulicola]|uniref:Outer membrane protein beta-barrel domain-containing protein n=1 Tax=Photobacterium gaetbulicola TaxID=1295392 RepID=A0A0B9G5W6_9GAMM|nr:hypothetical protein [Photobacterium gaetbulicola]KHT64118.1 hypothetical protein RJ45_08490 [Photobacterium gaetbulicola]